MARYTFEKTPATEQTDAEHRLLRDGQPTRIVVQDCTPYGGGYSVNVEFFDHPTNPYMEHVAEGVRSFREAADVAIARDQAPA